MKKLALLTLVLGDLIASTILGIGLGYFAWQKWQAPGWVITLCSLAGLILGFYRLIQHAPRLFQKDEQDGLK